MIGITASSAVVGGGGGGGGGGVDPVVLAIATASVPTATSDIGIARSLLEPAGFGIGDLLVAAPKINGTTPTWQSKVGDPAWTLFAQNNTTAGSAVLYRITDGTEPATLTFTRSTGTSGAEMDIWRFKAGTFDPANPLDVAGFVAVSSATVILPAVVTTVARTLLCESVARMVAASGNSWLAQGDNSGTPGNPTELFDVLSATNNLQAAGGSEQLTAAGNTGTRTWTQTGTGACRGTIFAVRSKP